MSDYRDQSFELTKLREEIKSLRLQRIILILATLGGIVSFFIVHYSEIFDIFNPPPKFSLFVVDPFLKENGVIEIHKLESGIWKKEIEATPIELEKCISISEGSFVIRLLFNNEVFLSKQVHLKRGDMRIFKFEDIVGGIIRVKVINKTKNVLPNTPLRLEITSSGKGYVWIFDITPEKQLKLVYPQPGSNPDSHEILPISKYLIPDSKKFGVFSGDVPGTERILFVVTSSPNESLAVKIASNFSRKTTVKAHGGVIKIDYGVYVESYDIKLP